MRWLGSSSRSSIVSRGSRRRAVCILSFFFFQAEDGIRDIGVTGVQTCALPILLLLNPAVLAAYVLGAPFLILRLQKSPAAQLLLATLLLVPVVCFVPPIAGLVGEIIGPWIIPRLAWPIPLAAVLVLGWLLWEGLAYLGARLSARGFWTTRTSTLLLALTLVTAGLLAVAPFAVAQLESVDASGETPQEEASCSDPVFTWMEGGF